MMSGAHVSKFTLFFVPQPLMRQTLTVADWSTWVNGKFCDGPCGGNGGARGRYRKCDNPAPRGSQEHCQLVDGTRGLEEKELNFPCINNDICDGKTSLTL